jgi:hypothetical protein
MPDLVAALRRMREEPDLQRSMIANGHERAKESDPAVITGLWLGFFKDVAEPAYEKWRKASDWQRRLFRWNGRLKTNAQDLQERFWH